MVGRATGQEQCRAKQRCSPQIRTCIGKFSPQHRIESKHRGIEITKRDELDNPFQPRRYHPHLCDRLV